MTIKQIKDWGLLLLECMSGSRAYGLNTENSDIDIKGVYFLPKEKFYGLDYIPQVSNETNDEVYYELGRFVSLLIRNNPTALELLATPDESVLFRSPVMQALTIDMFLSKLCKETFGRYAFTQVRKARGYNKKINNPVSSVRKSVLDFCFVITGHSSIPLDKWLAQHGYVQARCGLSSIPHSKGLYSLYYDDQGTRNYKGISSGDTANEVSLSAIEKDEKALAYLSFNLDGYSSYCREYSQYWDWVKERSETRYKVNMDHGNNYDSKNMMHTIRLLQVAVEIARDRQLNVRRKNREELLSIKAGRYEYDALLEMADRLVLEMDALYEASNLPDQPDQDIAEQTLVQMRTHLYSGLTEFTNESKTQK